MPKNTPSYNFIQLCGDYWFLNSSGFGSWKIAGTPREQKLSWFLIILTIFKVGFPGAILFMIAIQKANITEILEIRWNSRRSIIILIFFHTQTNIKLIMKMLNRVKIKVKVIVPLVVLMKSHKNVGKGPNHIPMRSMPTNIIKYMASWKSYIWKCLKIIFHKLNT